MFGILNILADQLIDIFDQSRKNAKNLNLIQELLKGQRVNVKIMPMFIFLYRNGSVHSLFARPFPYMCAKQVLLSAYSMIKSCILPVLSLTDYYNRPAAYALRLMPPFWFKVFLISVCILSSDITRVDF